MKLKNKEEMNLCVECAMKFIHSLNEYTQKGDRSSNIHPDRRTLGH